jgi:hypothetical protein
VSLLKFWLPAKRRWKLICFLVASLLLAITFLSWTERQSTSKGAPTEGAPTIAMKETTEQDTIHLAVDVIQPGTKAPIADVEVVIIDSGVEVKKRMSNAEGVAQFDIKAGNYTVVARLHRITQSQDIQLSNSTRVTLTLAAP